VITKGKTEHQFYMKAMFASPAGRDARLQVSEYARTFGDTPLNFGYITLITAKRCHRCEIHCMGVRKDGYPFL